MTHAGPGEHEFLTDRGPEILPAYCLRGPAISGQFWVLDPAIEFWQPPPRAPRSHRARSDGGPAVAVADRDRYTRSVAAAPDGRH